MNIIVQQYIDTGRFNNNLYFPYNKSTIISYIKKLINIQDTIKSENIEEIISYTIKKCDNIFIASYILYATNTTDNKYLEFIYNLVQNKWDLYILINFILEIENKKLKTAILKNILNNDSFISTETEKILIKNNLIVKTPFSKIRRKNLHETKEKFYDGTFSDGDIELLHKYNIHPDELDYYLSYTLQNNVKEKVFSFYLEKYDLQNLIFTIDKSYVQNIPATILCIIDEKLKNITDIEQIIYLFIYKDKISNISLKDTINNSLNTLTLNCFETKVVKDIRIYINPKYNVYIDKEDKLNYLHYLATYVAILSKIYKLPVFVNDIDLNTNEICDTIIKIKSAEISMSYKNINCPILDNSLVFSNIEVSAFARWNILDKNGEDYSDNLIISGFNTKNFMEVLSILG